MSNKKKSGPKGLKKSAKKLAVYEALKDGAANGLSGDGLYAHVQAACPEASNKAIVKAAFLTLSDPDITDRGSLDALYDLAIKHRLAEEPMPNESGPDEPAPEAAETAAPKADKPGKKAAK